KQQVVAENRILRDRIYRINLQRLRHKVFRIGERQRCGVKDVRIEERPHVRKVSGENGANLLAIPRENPHVENGITEIPCDGARHPALERPRHDDRNDEVRSKRVETAPHQSTGVSAESSWSSTCTIAAVGTARIAPTIPSSDPPISRATITPTGLMPT